MDQISKSIEPGETLFEKKWGADVAADGHGQLPHTLVRNQGRLKLKDGEFLTLVALIDSWWDLHQLPCMSTATLAKRRGLKQRTIELHLAALKEKGLIEKSPRQGTKYVYTFDGLQKKLEGLAKERAASENQPVYTRFNRKQ